MSKPNNLNQLETEFKIRNWEKGNYFQDNKDKQKSLKEFGIIIKPINKK